MIIEFIEIHSIDKNFFSDDHGIFSFASDPISLILQFDILFSPASHFPLPLISFILNPEIMPPTEGQKPLSEIFVKKEGEEGKKEEAKKVRPKSSK